MAVKKSRFLESIARARAATETTSPATKPVEEMNDEEMNEALRLARIEAVEANRAVAAVAAEEYSTRPPTLAANLRELQRKKKRHWR